MANNLGKLVQDMVKYILWPQKKTLKITTSLMFFGKTPECSARAHFSPLCILPNLFYESSICLDKWSLRHQFPIILWLPLSPEFPLDRIMSCGDCLFGSHTQ